ncbi:hypothetical protein WA026_019748 [Henosepilachna vigintioctopunctata]|uniref:LisH domain-containing protein n=1 Tax=Henosepilachna vigintioctopunctata TaxID=420089 RepID=A0AAW1UN54_9CUCU
MEIGKPQLARLVLGYLKNENCTKAFNEFLTTSKYLSQHALFAKNGKYFATRVGGQTLEDIINEYTEVSLIIQGKLEQTSYYEEQHKMNLVEQLKYILDYEFEHCPVLPNILNTTPSESLPGNSSPKITSKGSNSQVSAAFGGCSPIECPENISQILSQTLLEKPELQKKLACVINKARKSHNQDHEAEDASDQLDEKIRSIIQKAEDDYLFDNILGEIIGTKSDVPDNSSSKSYNNTESPKPTSSKSKEKKVIEPTEKQMPTKEPVREQSSVNPPSNSQSPNFKNLPNVSTANSNSEVLIFNGNLDSYVGKTASILPTSQSQIYVTNTPGVLMLPPVITAPNYFIVNNQRKQVSNVLTDTDIMKMPTVILDEGPSQNRNNDIENSLPKSRKCKPIVPKSDGITISSVGTGDYLAIYNDEGRLLTNNSSVEEPPPTTKATSKSTPKPVLRKKLPRQAKSKNKDGVTEENTQKRPITPVMNVGLSEVKKATPKSSSHIRALDFDSSTCNAEEKEERCSSKKVSTAKKSASKNLFNQGKKIEKRTAPVAWDAELRELLIPKKIPVVSPDTSYDNIDADEDDTELNNQAKLIEEAFKTPSKKEPENESITLEKQTASPTREESAKEDVVEEELDNKKDESVETLTVTETQVYLRNCNGPPKFRKKCNPSNNTVQTCEVEVIIEKNESIEKRLEAQTITEVSQDHVEFKRNILLETPIKELPKTPGKCELTPFSRELEEQIRGMDLLSLPTPYLPITPSFPITPSLDLNTPVHASRPTDYSTSSSYYQPSDTEQNKSLEAMIEECKKLEKRNQKVTEEENRNPSSSAKDIKQVFNQTVIGKKNLNLMKQISSSSESSDDSDSSCSTSESSSSSDSDYDKTTVDDVTRKDAYCLRRRTITPKADPKSIKPMVPAKTSNKIKSLTEEIIAKRERMLQLLKNDEKDAQKTPQNNNQAKEKVSKTVKKSVSRRKTRSPIKLKTNEQISKLFDVENEITDDDFALHLSTDEDSTNKPAVDGAAAKDKEENSVIPSSLPNTTLSTDLEAEQLVQGLKERGILLMHKKSPNKNDSVAMETDEKKDIDSRPARHNSEADGLSSHEPRQVISKIKEREMENKEMDIPIIANAANLSTSSNDLDVSFDVKFFSEEQQLKVNFVSSKRKSKKTIYDSSVLTKEMKANVYIESLDMEMERIIKCTSFEVLLDIPTNKATGKSKKKNLKSDQSLSCPPTESQENFKSKLNICDTKASNRNSKNTTSRKTNVSEKKVLVDKKCDKSNQSTKSKSTSKKRVSEQSENIDCSQGKDNLETNIRKCVG